LHKIYPKLDFTKVLPSPVKINPELFYKQQAVNTSLALPASAQAIGNRTITVYDASDERKKDIIGETERGLSDILKWSIKDFTWKPEWDRDSTTINTGAIAQELYKVNPELVNKHEIEDENGDIQDGVWGIEYIKTIPYLIKAVQELSAKVETLEAQVSGST